MIITKTPIRVSFFGGGTDYPDYFQAFGGRVLSTTIDKYIYVMVKRVPETSDFKFKINYSKIEKCLRIDEIDHPVVRACLNFLDIRDSLEIHVMSDLPARSGTGSSSSFTVGLLNALYKLKGHRVTKMRLAQEAIYIEQVVLGERVGVQDQLAAAFGGLNCFEFGQGKGFVVNKVIMEAERKNRLESNLLMFYTGISRFAHDILEEQVTKTQQKTITPDLNKIKSMVSDGLSILNGKDSLDAFGILLDQAWNTKRSLSTAVSSTFLDDIYARAKIAGALGGKLLGAGGGGFFIFYVDENFQQYVREALSDLIEVKFCFVDQGTKSLLV